MAVRRGFRRDEWPRAQTGQRRSRPDHGPECAVNSELGGSRFGIAESVGTQREKAFRSFSGHLGIMFPFVFVPQWIETLLPCHPVVDEKPVAGRATRRKWNSFS